MIDNEIDDSKNSNKTHITRNDSKNDADEINEPQKNITTVNSIAHEISLPVIQFPSPNVEKSYYQVVTLDTTINKSKSLCLTIEDNKEGMIVLCSYSLA